MLFQTTQISLFVKLLSITCSNKWLPFTMYPAWSFMAAESKASTPGIMGLISNSQRHRVKGDMQKSPASVLNELGKQNLRHWSNDLEKKNSAGAVCLHRSWAGSSKSREENVLVVQVRHSGCQATLSHVAPLASSPNLWTSKYFKKLLS